jgi:hypothetical protein
MLCMLSSTWSKVKVTLRLTVGQSVCLGVEPQLELMTRRVSSYMKVTVLSIWGALSDERSGLSFVSHPRPWESLLSLNTERRSNYEGPRVTVFW